jgi:hypothetical protein
VADAPAPFIVGVGRSGTTLLRLMLDAHPELAIPSETHFLAYVAQHAHELDCDRLVDTMTRSATWPNMAIDAADFARAVDAVQPFSVAEAIRAFYRLYARQLGKPRWGDKTPPYRSSMHDIEHLLPEARFIHVVRDGRDAALSYRGLWFGPGDDIEAQARFWVEQIGRARAQSATLRHYLEVRYETLVMEPERELRRIADYLELPFHPAMLDYHRSAEARLAEMTQPFGPPGAPPVDLVRFLSIHERVKTAPDPRRIARWREEMPDAERARYEAIAGPLLADLGYETGRARR